MSIRLILLGFLNERPLYGYEIKQLIEQRMGDWTDVKYGSIYFSLDKMTKEGFIYKKEEVQEGSRPKRIIYGINDSGKKEFLRLVKESWTDIRRDYLNFDLAVYNMSFMEKDEVISLLEKRIRQHNKSLEFLSNHEKKLKMNSNLPLQAFAITDHSRIHMEAEKKWLEDLLKNLDSYF